MLLADKLSTEPDDWGLGMVIRGASVPFDDNNVSTKESVSSAVPMLYFQSKYLYMDGLEGGVKYDFGESWRIALISRLRFSDIPKEYQGAVQLSTYDFGPQLRYKLNKRNFIDLEGMTHAKGYGYANLSYKGRYDFDGLELKPYATLRLKSDKFNSRYYALDSYTDEKIGAGVDYTLGLKTKYHLVSNLYLLAGGEVTFLDQEAKSAAVVKEDYQYNVYAGIGAFKAPPKGSNRTLTNTPYIRASWGWATHKDLDQILTGSMAKDEYFNQLVSVFYGHPLTDSLFGLPFDIYLTPGFVLHLKSDVQPEYLREYVIGFKAYYTIPMPIRVRLGAAEGLSYINEVTWIERTDVEEDNTNGQGNLSGDPSNLLNYLDFSAGVNLGDLFYTESMENTWFGFNIHHRSGIFSNSAQFGRVTGGSNYPSLYLQLHL